MALNKKYISFLVTGFADEELKTFRTFQNIRMISTDWAAGLENGV